MSLFSRKPNPPVPAIPAGKFQQGLQQATAQVGARGANGQPSPVGNPNVEKAQSNNRFRSFAERYIVERCRDWKEGEIDERAWATILEAKSIYNKVREVGRTLGDDT